MFVWNDFSAVALDSVERSSTRDEELRSVLTQRFAPAEATNEVGQPLPGSAVICQHPDIPNYNIFGFVRRIRSPFRGGNRYANGFI